MFTLSRRAAVGSRSSCPPRTVGFTAMRTGRGSSSLEAVGEQEAVGVTLRSRGAAPSTEAAKEKVGFCSRRGDTLIYQADRQNRSAALCACGNATGATAAMLAHYFDTSEVRQKLEVPGGQLEVFSLVTCTENGSWRVRQSWRGIRLDVRPTTLAGRDVAVCTGTLNDYLIVRLPAADLETFDLPEVLALWQEAKRFGFDNPLQARLVAIAPGNARPFTKFYTCGRNHPGAPLTGLATLALAAHQVDWLPALLERGEIEHRRGVDELPPIKGTATGKEIHFPTIDVVLEGI